MVKRMTPSQTVLGFAVTLAVCYVGTAIAWKWPDSGYWPLATVVVLAAVFLFFVYRAARKEERQDSLKDKKKSV